MPDTLRKPDTLLVRWLGKVRTGTDEECWPWLAACSANGYGRIGVPTATGYGTRQAHRIGYALFVGRIPPGLKVLHRCDNPPCRNPTHLFLGTQADNMRDKVQKGRQSSTKGWRRSHCRNGLHEMSGDNVLTRRTGERRCRACENAGQRARKRARKNRRD